MTEMPMFPLGSVLFPAMPTALRIFEERYIVMLSAVLQDEPARFGIVLIERGSEVGGGEHRFPIGTIAEISQMEASEGFIGLIAQGGRRIEVVDWLPDDPYPRAEVREVPDLEWREELRPLFVEAEQLVRRTLAQASEFVEQQWGADIELADDPHDALWQLAGIAPLGPLDQVKLLRATDAEQLLRDLIELTAGAAEMLTVRWDDDDDFPRPEDFGEPGEVEGPPADDEPATIDPAPEAAATGSPTADAAEAVDAADDANGTAADAEHPAEDGDAPDAPTPPR